MSEENNNNSYFWFFAGIVGLLFVYVIFASGFSSPGNPIFRLVDFNGSFLDLNDTPSNPWNSNDANKLAVVNLDGNAIVFKDLNEVGDFNESYGQMWQDNSTNLIVIPAQDTIVTVDDFNFTMLKNFTQVDTNSLKATIGGEYLVNWGLSFSDGVTNEIEGMILINGVRQQAGTAHRTIGTGGDVGNISSTLLIDLNVNDEVSLGVVNQSNNNDVTVEHASVTIVPSGDILLGVGSDGRIKVSDDDTQSGFAEQKIVAGTDISIVVLNDGSNEQLEISASASAGDTNCSNNPDCILTGTINTSLDAQFTNIDFNGVLSGNDFNYSLSDANDSQSCPLGQALQSVGNSTSCVNVGGSNDLNWSSFNTFFNPGGSGVPDENILNSDAYLLDTNAWTAGIISDANEFQIDLNTVGGLKAGNDLLCDSGTCYTISDLNRLTIDTNWQTSYNLLDENLSLTFYKQSDANIVLVKVEDFNSFGDQRYNQISDSNNFSRLFYEVISDWNNVVLNSNDWNSLGINSDTNAETACGVGEVLLGDGTCTLFNNDLNWDSLNSVVPWEDVNVANDITLDNITQITNRSYNDLQDLPDIPTDATIDSNVHQVISGLVPWTDGNVNIGFGDLNDSSDVNDGYYSAFVLSTVFNDSFPIDYDTNIDNKPHIPTESEIDSNASQQAHLVVSNLVPWLDENVNITFLDVNDTPASYSGEALNFLRVNAGETGIEFFGFTPGPTWDELNNVIPWQDVNVANDITLDNITQITNRSYNDLQDLPHIPTEAEIDSNASQQAESVVAALVPWQDANVSDDITVNGYSRWSELDSIIPWVDANIANSVRYLQDASCDNNVNCQSLISAGNLAFKVDGFGETGQSFTTDVTGGSVELKVFGISRARLYLAGTAQDSWAVLARDSDPSFIVDTNFSGTRSYFRNYADGNQHMMFNVPQLQYLPVGGWQSDSAPDYNLDRVMIREDLNIDQNLLVREDVNIVGTQHMGCARIFWSDANSRLEIHVDC